MTLETIKESFSALRSKYEKDQKTWLFQDAATSLQAKVEITYFKRVLTDLAPIMEQADTMTPDDLNLALTKFLYENARHFKRAYTALPNNDVTGLLFDIASFVKEKQRTNRYVTLCDEPTQAIKDRVVATHGLVIILDKTTDTYTIGSCYKGAYIQTSIEEFDTDPQTRRVLQNCLDEYKINNAKYSELIQKQEKALAVIHAGFDNLTACTVRAIDGNTNYKKDSSDILILFKDLSWTEDDGSVMSKTTFKIGCVKNGKYVEIPIDTNKTAPDRLALLNRCKAGVITAEDADAIKKMIIELDSKRIRDNLLQLHRDKPKEEALQETIQSILTPSVIELLLPSLAVETKRPTIMPLEGCNLRIIDTQPTEDEMNLVKESREILILYDKVTDKYRIAYNKGEGHEYELGTLYQPSAWDITPTFGFLKSYKHKPESITTLEHITSINTWLIKKKSSALIQVGGHSRVGYPDLNKETDVKKIVQTHIFGRDELHLIPVRLMTEVDKSPSEQPLMNPYVSSERSDDDPIRPDLVEKEEYARLQAHSSLTRAVILAAERYRDVLKKDDRKLLPQLTKLCANLNLHCAYGSGCHAVIIYTDPSPADKNRVIGSSAVLIIYDEVNKTYRIGFKKNEDYTEVALNDSNVDPATLAIFDAYTSKRADGITDAAHVRAINTVLNKQGSTMNVGRGSERDAGAGAYPAIIEFMEYYQKLYDEDKGEIPHALKKQIEILFGLITDFNQNREATSNIQTCIAIRKSELEFAMKGHDQTLSVIPRGGLNHPWRVAKAKFEFEAAQEALERALATNKYPKDGQDEWEMSVDFITSLGITTILAVPPKIILPTDFLTLVKPLSDKIRMIFYKAMTSEWASIIKSVDDCRVILESGTPEERSVFFDAVKTLMPHFILSIRDFVSVEAYLDPVRLPIVFNLIKPKLDILVCNARDFRAIRKYLSEEEQAEFLVGLQERLPDVWADIKYEAFIDTIKQGVLVGVVSNLKKTWLGYQKKYVDLEMAASDAWEASVGLVEGLIFGSHTPNRAQIRRQLIQLRANNFDIDMAESLSSVFSNQIDEFSPGSIMNRLFESHPWIHADPESSLVHSFVSHILEEQLHLALKPACKSWEDVPESLFDALNAQDSWFSTSKFEWNPIDQNWLASRAKGHPFSDVRQHYVSKLLPRYKSFNSHALAQPWASWHLTRIDIFRILARQYPAAVVAKSIADVASTAMAPMHVDELARLSEAQLHHCKTLLINCGTEEEALWIALHQKGSQWTAYLPEMDASNAMYSSIENALGVIRQTLPGLITYDVNYDVNTHLNDITTLDPRAIWHAVLLGRVVPGCQKRPMDIAAYRNAVPLPVLLESVLRDSLQKKESIQALTSSFTLRSPLSNHTVDAPQPAPYLFATSYDPAEVPHLLTYFNKKQCLIDSSNNTVTIALDAASKKNITDVFSIIYRTPLTRLVFTPSDQKDEFLCDLHRYDAHLQSIIPYNKEAIRTDVFAWATCCAARNRFLATLDPTCLTDQSLSVESRQQLWAHAGQKAVTFFQQPQALDLDFVEAVTAFNPEWIKQYCDHTHHGDLTESQWAFVQMAQMGIEGLKVMFDHLDTYTPAWDPMYKEYAPKLSCLLDLSGNATVNNPLEYIQTLTARIQAFGGGACAPLFSSLSLILPQPLHRDCADALQALLLVLNARKKTHPEEPDEVLLYHLNIDDEETQRFIANIPTQPQVSESGEISIPDIVVRIPAWDRKAFTERPQQVEKAKYRAMQNKILDNQRTRRAIVLEENTKKIRTQAMGTLDPLISIKPKQAFEEQIFEGAEIWYPLTEQSAGVQQQQEQEQEQEQQQEQQQDHEKRPEVEDEDPETVPKIEEYTKDVVKLITRENINTDENIIAYWSKLGGSAKELCALFSQWVGSRCNDQQVIEKIDPDAIYKIMDYAARFKLGVPRDNLPAGFYLARREGSPALILALDGDKEKKDRFTRAALEPKLRNPYTIILHDAKPGVVMSGDFRQLFIEEHNATLWRYLATEDGDKKRLAQAAAVLPNPPTAPENSSVVMQGLDALGEIKQPASLDDCKYYLRQWATTQGASAQLCDALLDTMTDSNLKALGQLFNDYGTQKVQPNGIQHWLMLAGQMLEAFGAVHFAVWKKRLLDPSHNWSECLDQDELDALALSMATLQHTTQEKNSWWALVSAHGRTTGHMRYAPVWTSYQALLKYTEEHHLILNEKSMLAYLESATEFNAQVFLDRLCFVLKKSNKELYGREIGQHILDNIEHVDWQHNGFYFASRYNDYPYWDPSLQLHDFTPTLAEHPADYHVAWSVDAALYDPLTHALRFASQRVRLSFPEFQSLRDFLETHSLKDTRLLRVLSGCLAMGVDTVDSLTRVDLNDLGATDPAILAWIDNQYALDGVIQRNQIQLRAQDIVLFARALNNHPKLKEYCLKLQGKEAIQCLNACGRALQCYAPEKNAEAKMSQFLTFANRVDKFNHPLVTDYPWLVNTYNTRSDPVRLSLAQASGAMQRAQVAKFREQLQSIDFSKTTYWPAQETLGACFRRIATSDNPIEMRRTIVDEWIHKKCDITLQDALFRPLVETELTKALKQLDSRMELNFKDQNLSLARRFLSTYLAVETEGEYTAQITAIIDLFIDLDNKVYFNELGQILGLLMTHANQKPKRLYSAPQLHTWLTAFIDQTMDKKERALQHYPLNLLNELLISKPAETLLNSHLNILRAVTLHPTLIPVMQTIVVSPLSSQYKPALVKVALSPPYSLDFVKQSQEALVHLAQIKGVDSTHLDAVTRLINHLVEVDAATQKILLQRLTVYPSDVDSLLPWLIKAWSRCQITLINKFIEGRFTADTTLNLFAVKKSEDYLINIILIHIVRDVDSGANVIKLKSLLSAWTHKEIKELAQYCAQDPHPSVETLTLLLTDPASARINPRTWRGLSERKEDLALPQLIYNNKSALDVIHHFESVIQARDGTPESKRHYSLSDDLQTSLMRVLDGIKRKGQGVLPRQEKDNLVTLFYYTNHFALVEGLGEQRMPDLLNRMHAARESIKDSKTPEDKQYASARLLACMREILLRKTGKWVNHTQMLDLLYAAVHNNESLLHQLRTGEGKSILTVMRTAFLALTGNVVDVFSAKESLSRRDQAEFEPVLSAMEIRNGYITAKSGASEYYDTVDARGIGAVNYATVGNFSLFQSHHRWKGDAKITLDPAHRVAFLDEADHVLMDEQTQINYSDTGDNKGTYNLDEWVYRATYDFYLKHQHTFKHDRKSGTIAVSNQKHLNALSDYLRNQAVTAPEGSLFLAKYIIPALKRDPELVQIRDNQLKKLLAASHKACQLKDGVEYCTKAEKKQVGRLSLDTRCAKVMIDNQIIEGASYSELVHQFLHVRLNKEAADKGEKPDFFVEPVSQVALSQNAAYILKKYYSKIEGCTGTAGNKAERAFYASAFGIKQIIKLPTHAERRTVVLPTIYCDSEEQQLEAIAKVLSTEKKQPKLLLCQDDVAVKAMSAYVIEKTSQKTIIVDTNASGKTEDEVSAKAGLDGAVTFLLCQDDVAVNAMSASVIEKTSLETIIVDTNASGKTEDEVSAKAGLDGAVTFSARMARGTNIVPEDRDLGLMVLRTFPDMPRSAKQGLGRQGRNGAGGTCLDIINYGAIKKDFEHYLETARDRLLAIFDEEAEHVQRKLEKHAVLGFKSAQWKHLNEDEEDLKKYLVTRTVVQLKHDLKQESKMYIQSKNQLMAALGGEIMSHILDEQGPAIKTQWLETSAAIERLWDQRFTEFEVKQDSEAVYNQFIIKATSAWETLCDKNESLKRDLINIYTVNNPPVALDAGKSEDIAHQETADLANFFNWWIDGPQAKYSTEKSDLEGFYKQLYKVTGVNSQHKTQRAALCNALQGVMDTQSGYLIKLGTYAPVIEQLAIKLDSPRYQDYFDCFKHFFSQSWLNVQDASSVREDQKVKISLLLKMITNIVTMQDIQAQEEKEGLFTFITNFSEVIRDHFTNQFDASMAARIESIFATNADVTRLLTLNSKKQDLQHYVALIEEGKDLPDASDRRTRLVKYLIDENLKKSPTAAVVRDEPKPETYRSKRKNKIKTIPKKARTPRSERELGQLDQYPEVIPSVFTIGLIGRQSEQDMKDLPTPHCLKAEDPSIEPLFWHFLSQRSPITQVNVSRITNLLSTFREDEVALKALIQNMDALPPYVSLDYIGDNALKGHGNYLTCINNISKIKLAGEAWCLFMRDWELVNSADHYTYPQGDHKHFDEFQLCFNRMSPERNAQFFNTVRKYKGLGIERLKSLAYLFINQKSMDQTLLEQIGVLGNDVISLQVKSIAQSFDTRILENSDPIQNMASFRVFVGGIVEAQKTHAMDEKAIEALWEVWEAGNITKIDELNDSIDIMQQAKILQDSSNNAIQWQHLFVLPYALDPNNQKIRQDIMQQLTHSMLDIGQEFTTEFKKQYKQLASTLLKDRNELSKLDKSIKNAKRRRSLHTHYEPVVRLAREMAEVAKNPYSAKHSSDVGTTTAVSDAETWMSHWVDNRTSGYVGTFFKSTTRADTAGKMIGALNDIRVTDDLTIGGYYLKALEHISKAQKEILDSDKDHGGRNTKGYSRLYDICSQMYLEIARKLLETDGVTPTERMQLNDQLQEQFKVLVLMLKDRLKESNPLKIAMSTLMHGGVDPKKWLVEGSSELVKFKAMLEEHRRTIPSKLHYLLPHIDLTCTLYAPESSSSVQHRI